MISAPTLYFCKNHDAFLIVPIDFDAFSLSYPNRPTLLTAYPSLSYRIEIVFRFTMLVRIIPASSVPDNCVSLPVFE